MQEVEPLAPTPIPPAQPATPVGAAGRQVIIIEKIDQSESPPTVIIEQPPASTGEQPIIIERADEPGGEEVPAATEPTEGTKTRKRYSHYDHICVTYDRFTITDTLNDAGNKGWELVSLGGMGDNDQLLCFRRPRGLSF